MLPDMLMHQSSHMIRLLLVASTSGALLAAALLPTAASAAADDEQLPTSGSAVIHGSEQVSIDETAGMSPFTTTNAGGGRWDYGIGGGYSYSYYFHKTASHRSTACSRTACAKTGWAPGNVTTHAKALKTAGGNTAYWDKR
jgi:lactococcin 972 family bacteriocin